MKRSSAHRKLTVLSPLCKGLRAQSLEGSTLAWGRLVRAELGLGG